MNAYKVLQVDKKAEQEVIDAAYRRLASKYHPDRDPSPEATARMKEINAAYEILRDPERRAGYDRRRERVRTQGRRHEARPEEPAATPASAPSPTVSQEFAAEVSNRLFRKVLWAAAFIALLVYVPWGIALLIGIWGGHWLFKNHRQGVVRFLQWSLAASVALGVYLWIEATGPGACEARRRAQLGGWV